MSLGTTSYRLSFSIFLLLILFLIIKEIHTLSLKFYNFLLFNHESIMSILFIIFFSSTCHSLNYLFIRFYNPGVLATFSIRCNIKKVHTLDRISFKKFHGFYGFKKKVFIVLFISITSLECPNFYS